MMSTLDTLLASWLTTRIKGVPGTYVYKSNFDCIVVPSVPLEGYISRFTRMGIPENALLMTCVLVERVGVTITHYNVHRLFVAALVVACKYLLDDFDQHYTIAIAGGINVSELDCMELEVLQRLDFDAWVDPLELNLVHRELLEGCPDYKIHSMGKLPL